MASGGENLKQTDDDEEEEEPPEFKNQDDFPPTPYEECLDLNAFEVLAKQEQQESQARLKQQQQDSISLNYIGMFSNRFTG